MCIRVYPWLMLVFSVAGAPLVGQPTIPNGAPDGYRFDGGTEEWAGVAPTFRLRAVNPGARTGAIWVRQVPEGLLIAGKLNGPAPDFATNAAELARKEHVDLWIAAEDPPRFPEIGWSNHLNEYSFSSADDCDSAEGIDDRKECREWFASTVRYRRRLEQLFVRRYQMAPQVVTEAYAKPAYDELEIAELALTRKPSFREQATAGGGYSFEALLPWEAFPPVNTLEVRSLRLMVEVVPAYNGPSQGRPFSTTSDERRYSDASKLDPVTLEAGRQFHITACSYDLAGYFFPGRGDSVTKVISFRNVMTPYLYHPAGQSPEASATGYFQKEIPGGAVLCGPTLAYHRGDVTKHFEGEVDVETLAAQLQPNGDYLVRSGPRFGPPAGVGTCGGCGHILLDMYRLTRQGELQPLKQVDAVPPMGIWGKDVQFRFSPDWHTITTYILKEDEEPGKEDHWESWSECLQGGKYEPCGERRTGEAPPAEKPEPTAPIAASKRVLPPAESHEPGTIKINPRDGLSYAWVPAGTFRMGCSPDDTNCHDDEKPAHSVTLTRGFWIGQTPVTVRAYQKFIDAAGGYMPAPPKNFGVNLNPDWRDGRQPMVKITWEEARTYCESTGMRLPTEAEWEMAARAGTAGARYGSPGEIAWYLDNSGTQPIDGTAVRHAAEGGAENWFRFVARIEGNRNGLKRVGLKLPNAYRLFDMLGNVGQWVADWYGDYSAVDQTDPVGPVKGDRHVERGGSWFDVAAVIRASSRYNTWAPTGVRCAGDSL